MTVSFVDCSANLLPSLREFMARVYRPDYILCRDERLFHWQFGKTTNADGSVYRLKLAQIDDRTMGCLGYVPVDVSLRGRIVRGVWLINWMVDPLQRRLGLGPLLMREVTGEFDVALNIGPNKDARDILSRMGWTDFGTLARYVCVLDAGAAGELTRTGKLQWPAVATPVEERHQTKRITTTLVDRFCEDATQLWEAVWGRSAGTFRSAEFLNRRYAEHPVFKYRLHELRQEGRLCGLAVLRVEQVRDSSVRVGRILEFVSLPDTEEYLLQEVLDDALSQGVAVVDFFCSSKRFSEVMIHHGFLSGEDEAAAQLPTLFQPIDWKRQSISFMAYLRNAPDAIEVDDWYVTKGDGDQDRPN